MVHKLIDIGRRLEKEQQFSDRISFQDNTQFKQQKKNICSASYKQKN